MEKVSQESPSINTAKNLSNEERKLPFLKIGMTERAFKAELTDRGFYWFDVVGSHDSLSECKGQVIENTFFCPEPMMSPKVCGLRLNYGPMIIDGACKDGLISYSFEGTFNWEKFDQLVQQRIVEKPK